MKFSNQIGPWHVETTVLTDGSEVYDVIGASDEARVVFNCVDETSARMLCALLGNEACVSGASAESM